MSARRPVTRRRVLAAGGAALVLPRARAVEYPRIEGPRALAFPRDHGAHPEYRTEWWYVTGWLAAADGAPLGFQVTFFRNRPGVNEAATSRFAPRQLYFAHVALADPRRDRLAHDERAARGALDLAAASTVTTDVRVDDWSLVLVDDRYRTRIRAREFAWDLAFAPTQPILLQGEAGYSRKGPRPEQSSYYYSRPHLAVSGMLERGARGEAVRGSAWLDHEWSSEIMDAAAQGWDWIGLNLDDGGALMAFRMRGADGAVLWSAATWRDADGRVATFAASDVAFEPLRTWTSPRTGARYPVAMRVRVGTRTVELAPLIDDQELDSRASVGTVYWEGAVRAAHGGRALGRGYLELTGYWKRLRL